MIRIVFIFGIVFLSTASFGQTLRYPYEQSDYFSRIDIQSIKKFNPELFLNFEEPKVESSIRTTETDKVESNDNAEIRTDETEEESNMPIIDLSKNFSSNMQVNEFSKDFHSNMPIVTNVRVGFSIELDGIKK
ncbi:hypothetical protein [Cyclobacterium qasimii]|uniref:Uncharacterized protein n=2 Tax=Cyclobacterium qasimii TaxID=1350429 RepID=S7WVT5_9BACT|nr:hypothetical protein [Cyclobacterium qasimii]EPR68163.1 hypothetical protein ADICYQ_2883 [Cyclobacterium qasimii M12-11B]GEO19949.1 hypothetical protein CQA01_04830 [Cyclobacterium qasimii]